MAFIRIKKIKGKEYGYLIRNRWLKTRKQPKQKVVGYLGRIIRPEIEEDKKDVSFYDYKKIIETEDYISGKSAEEILKDLVEFELQRHGMAKEKGVVFDIKAGTLKIGGKDAVLKINEGYLCSHTIQGLAGFDARGEEEEVGLELAKRFVGAGIAIPHAIFIGFFSKIFK